MWWYLVVGFGCMFFGVMLGFIAGYNLCIWSIWHEYHIYQNPQVDAGFGRWAIAPRLDPQRPVWCKADNASQTPNPNYD